MGPRTDGPLDLLIPDCWDSVKADIINCPNMDPWQTLRFPYTAGLV